MTANINKKQICYYLEEKDKTKNPKDQINTSSGKDKHDKSDGTVTHDQQQNPTNSNEPVANATDNKTVQSDNNGEDDSTASNESERTAQKEDQLPSFHGSTHSDEMGDKTDGKRESEDDSANEKVSTSKDVIICSAEKNLNEEDVGEARSFQSTSVQTDTTPRIPNHLPAEESNFLRFCHLIQKIAPQAVRHRFDQVFPPADLEGIIQQNMTVLKDLYHNRVITRPQWKLICPSGSAPLSSTFDITTMVCLFRHLRNTSPNSGFYETLPPPSDVSLEADLSRIKYFRNNIAHYLEKDRKIDNNDFPIVWETASMAVSRIGGQIYEQECSILRTANLDSSYMNIYREVLIKETGLEQKITDLAESHQQLQSEYEKEIKQLQIKLEDPVPKHERENIKFMTDKWEANKHLFIETNAATNLIQIMKSDNVAIVTGSRGTGKTFTVQNVLLSLREEGYDVIPVRSSSDMVRYFSRSARQVFFLDNFCGKHNISNSDIEKWDRNHDRLVDMFTNSSTKCIFICRLQIFLDPKFQNLQLKKYKVINLSADQQLTLEDKQSIGLIHISKCIMEQLTDQTIVNCLCFPLLCSLYDKHDNHTITSTAYFEKPKQFFETELTELKERPDKTKYGCIALCVMLNNKVDLDFFSSTNKEGSKMAKMVFEELGVNVQPMKAIQSCFDSMVGSFFQKTSREDISVYPRVKTRIPGYKCIHDYMFDIYCVHVSKTMINMIILYGDGKLICDRTLLQSLGECDENSVIIPERFEKVYFERIFRDLTSCRVSDVFRSNQMKYDSYQTKFIKFLNLINFDVNIKDTYGKSPLHKASEAGYVDVVELLCKKGADVNLSDKCGLTALTVASMRGHFDVVKLLCNKGADVNLCDEFGPTPLTAASVNGHIDIVRLLCNQGVDVNLSRMFGWTPLTTSSGKRQIDVVELFCNKGADVNILNIVGSTALTAASERGHIDVVELLCNKGADVNLWCMFDSTPLTAGSFGGHIDVVKMLCNKGAEVNLSGKFGWTPLTAASGKGHIAVVELLCNKAAEINLSGENGYTPLTTASEKGHSDVVKLLCNKGADVNLCDNNGLTALTLALRCDQSDVVDILREIGATEAKYK